MGRLACRLSMMSLSSAGVISTAQPPLKVTVTLPCVRSITGLHGACVLTSWAYEALTQKSETVAVAAPKNRRFIWEHSEH
jgi:hypothetical protein